MILFVLAHPGKYRIFTDPYDYHKSPHTRVLTPGGDSKSRVGFAHLRWNLYMRFHPWKIKHSDLMKWITLILLLGFGRNLSVLNPTYTLRLCERLGEDIQVALVQAHRASFFPLLQVK